MNRSPLARVWLASAAFAAAIALAGCETDSPALSGRALKPISPKLLTEIAQKNMNKESPILIRIFKQESELEVWKEDSSGKFALLKSFPICRWSGDLGPKIKEGDRQAPEGFYTITPAQLNPASQYYLAFNMGFPNAYDQANGRTGAHLMVHGDCSSRGCYSMTDEQIAEIYALARESFFGGQRAFQVQAFPFRMTPINMAKHRNNPHLPFWKMLKEGYDHFEVTRLEPKVDVCDRRYVFNATAPGTNFSPRSQCPVYELPEDIVAAVAEKKRRDEVAIAELVKRGTPAAPVKLGTDGGMNPVFLAALQGRPIKGADGEITGYAPVSAPGTIPPTVNPPTPVALAIAPTEKEAAKPSPARAQSKSIMTRTASAQPAASGSRTASAKSEPPASPGVLSNLFTSSNSEANSSSSSIFDRAARAIGLRGSETATTAAARSAPPAKTAPAVATASLPKPQPAAASAETPIRTANAGAIAPLPKPAAPNAVAEVRTTISSASLLSGAAPVIPAGSFGMLGPALR